MPGGDLDFNIEDLLAENDPSLVDSGVDNLYSALSKGLMQRNWFSFWGPVTDTACEMCGMFLLNKLFQNTQEVTLFICSPGGGEDDTRALLAIMELCKQQGMIIRAYGAGCVASAAFDIFSACSKGYRFAFETTMFMTHSSSGHIEDEDMYDLQKEFDMWTLKQYTSIHAATRKRFLKTGNWWFDPKQAVEYGVADAVVMCGQPLPNGPINPITKSAEKQRQEAAQAAVEPEED